LLAALTRLLLSTLLAGLLTALSWLLAWPRLSAAALLSALTALLAALVLLVRPLLIRVHELLLVLPPDATPTNDMTLGFRRACGRSVGYRTNDTLHRVLVASLNPR
jgi:hypothetical protein